MVNNQTNQPWFYRAIEQAWYNAQSPWHYRCLKYALLPLVPIFCLLARFHRWKQEKHRPQHSIVPIIVVGNITVGGTGKTPLVIHLAELLKKAGYKPAIISRGYGGKAQEWPQSVTASSDPQWVGDEPVLMASRTNVPVVVGSDRNADIQHVLETEACNIIISDDGLQHYKMPRTLEIVVIDGKRRLGNGLCLPAGPLRESAKRLKTCDFVVTNGQNPEVAEYAMNMTGQRLVRLNAHGTERLDAFAGKTVHAVTGIGNPERFFRHLEQAGLVVIRHCFVDHHFFEEQQLMFDDNHPVLMTEKDAVKCRSFSIAKAWYLPIEAVLSTEFDQAVLTRLVEQAANKASI